MLSSTRSRIDVNEGTGRQLRRRWVSSTVLQASPRAAVRLPGGLLGMIALVVVVELFVARHPLDFSDPVSLSWRLAAEDARAKAPGCGVVCVGDSLVKHGVIPKVVEAGTGRRACNLATARGPAPATYFLLRRALDAGAKPAAVVLNFKPSVLVGGPRYNVRYWQEILTVGECIDLARVAGTGSLPFEILLGRVLPSFRCRHEIRSDLLAAVRGGDSPLRMTNRTCQRNWQVNDGANVATRNPAFSGKVPYRSLYSHVWYCHRVNAAYIRRTLELASARNVPVYWLLPPLSPGLQERREQSVAEEGYLKLVRSMEARFPSVKVVDGRHSGYGASVFVDATHLDSAGANTLSHDLAAIIASDLKGARSGPGWKMLPAYRDLPADPRSEDIARSQRIVSAAP